MTSLFFDNAAKDRVRDAGIAALRIGSGIAFMAHGILLKIFDFTIQGTVDYFVSIGYPAIMAYAVILVESIGGLLLVFGWHTRIVSLLLLPILIGATVEHWPNGWSFSNTGGGWIFPAFWALVMAVQAAVGSGRLVPVRASDRLAPALSDLIEPRSRDG